MQAWGDEGHRKGWCLFKMGCKGPEANYNCPTVRFNDSTSWPVKAGHGCIGCASPRFWDTKSPFYERLPHPSGFGVDVTAGEIVGWTVVAGVAAATAAHAVGHVVRDHFHPVAMATVRSTKKRNQKKQRRRCIEMARVVIDPVTRIEGHLRIETEISGGRVTDAWSSGTMFRGIELILRGRDPREAWIWAQRICGVCTTVHALASVRAVENALGIEIPDNARLVRNIIAGAQNVHDHVCPLLPPSCARLGRCDPRLEGRSREDFAACAVHLGMA